MVCFVEILCMHSRTVLNTVSSLLNQSPQTTIEMRFVIHFFSTADAAKIIFY